MDSAITPPAGPAPAIVPVGPDTGAQRALARHEHRLPERLLVDPVPRDRGPSTVAEGGIARLAQLQRALPPASLPGTEPIAHAVFPWTASAEATPLAITQNALLIKRATEPSAALAETHVAPAPGQPPAATDAVVLTGWTTAVNASHDAPGGGTPDGAGNGRPSAGDDPAAPRLTADNANPPPGEHSPTGADAPALEPRSALAERQPVAQPSPHPLPDARWTQPEPRPAGLALLDIAEDGRGNGAQQKGAAPLVATLRLDLPSLGPVELRLALSEAHADLAIYAGKDALARLAAGAPSLASSLAAWGISSSSPSYSPIRKS